ncbi:MAG: hypothetical protein AAFQ61_05810 [Cyanobacteria bacterium J06626_23]
MTVFATTQVSHPELLCHYLRVCPDHLAGALLIPGLQGCRETTKLYPEYWHWPTFGDGDPAAFLKLLCDVRYPPERYGFHAQLWCGLFAPPSKPYDLTVLCAALQGDSLQQVIEAMVLTPAKLYPSTFDLHELLEDLGLKSASETIRVDTATLERVCHHLLQDECRHLLTDHLQRLLHTQDS